MSEKKEQKKIDAVKVVLPTKRVAYLREMKISDSKLAARKVGKRDGNQLEMGASLQEELLKLLLIQIDDQRLDHSQKEDLDKILKVNEYNCLIKVIGKMGGDEGESEPEIELIEL